MIHDNYFHDNPIPSHSHPFPAFSTSKQKKKTKKIWEEIKEHMENGRKSTEGYEVKYVLQCKLVGLGNSFFFWGGKGFIYISSVFYFVYLLLIILCVMSTVF